MTARHASLGKYKVLLVKRFALCVSQDCTKWLKFVKNAQQIGTLDTLRKPNVLSVVMKKDQTRAPRFAPNVQLVNTCQQIVFAHFVRKDIQVYMVNLNVMNAYKGDMQMIMIQPQKRMPRAVHFVPLESMQKMW